MPTPRSKPANDTTSDDGAPPPSRRRVKASKLAPQSATAETIERELPEETPIALVFNGISHAVMLATPADLEDFALGFALTEGLARDASQIRAMRIAEAADGFILNLVLDPARAAAAAGRRRAIAGRSGCGLCGAQTIGAALPKLPLVTGPAPTMPALRAAYAALPMLQEMNAENRSTHAAAFCDLAGDILMLREDIGRHNALDKLGGALAGAGLRAQDGFILLSSRISVEMVQKAAMLGAPFLAAVSGPSALALRQATAIGMGLACGVGGDVMVFDTAPVAAGAAPSFGMTALESPSP
jgi:FdhD protein